MTDAPEGATAKAIREATAPITVKDGQGRQLVFRPMTATDQMRLFRLVDGGDSYKDEYMFYVRAAYMIETIDTTPVPRPKDLAGLDSNMDRLGNDGVVAWSNYLKAEAAALMATLEADASPTP